MNRALNRGLMLIAASLFAGAVGADVTGTPPAASASPADSPQGFIIAVPQNSAAAANVAEEPPRLPLTEVRAYRDEPVPCDRSHGTASEACRAQLAAKYAEMDKLCRIVSGAEIPVCIKSAYAAD